MKTITQLLPLAHRPVLGKTFWEEAHMKLVPLYKLQLPVVKKVLSTQQVPENSSPVCFAHLKGMREGFEDLG